MATLACAGIPSFASGPAQAQQQAASDATVQEVVIRSNSDAAGQEEVQRTPVLVTRFGQQKLQDLNINNTRDIAGSVPSLTQWRAGVTSSNSNYFFRGVGELDAQGQPSVGIYLDDAYFPRLLGSQIDLLDVNHIDAIPGPQGTSFPHDAEAGVVHIVTNTPDNNKRLVVESGFGNYNDRKVSILASGPIIEDQLYASLSASTRGRDGWTNNVTTGQKTNDIALTNTLGKLRWTPTQQLEFSLATDLEVDNGSSKSYGNLAVPGNTSSATYNPLYPYNHFAQYGGALTVSYKIDDHQTVKSISQVRHFEQIALYDNTSDLWARGSNWLNYRDNNYSQEFRWQGDYDRFNFKTGLYFNRDVWYSARRANAVSIYTDYFATPQKKSAYQPTYQRLSQTTDTYALYGSGDYLLTDKLKITLGGRYNYERQANDNYNYSLVSSQNVSSLQGGSYTTTDNYAFLNNPIGVLNWHVNNNAGWTSLSPKAVISYQILPEIMPYFSVSQGHKDGGFDFRAQGPTLASYIQAIVPYKPETLTTYEIGAKTNFFEQRLQLNAALFYNNFQDVQITALDPTTNTSHRFNAGHAYSEGAEFQATVEPVDDWTVGATGSLLFATLNAFDGKVTYQTYANSAWGAYLTVPTSPHSGATLPYSPRYQGSLYSIYKVPIDIPGVWKITGSVQAQSSYYTDALNVFFLKVPPQAYLNLGASYTTPDEHWTISVNAKNVANARYVQSYTYQAISAGNANAGKPAYWSAAYVEPFSIMASVRYTY
ncbi:iron complex outermembrane receptor protein [Rhodoblastus sphagnicola]|nr:TonB-dependent receptor [Rhodoblastus sphagnicola]MBB4200924.1 iron complex outermembrane receptor protein [Rhodoblastus sphagnicola]